MGVYDDTDVDDVIPDQMVDDLEAHAKAVVHGDKSFTENPKFNQLLVALNERSKTKKKVTKEEIDWLVE